jgi:hypothetical protein
MVGGELGAKLGAVSGDIAVGVHAQRAGSRREFARAP